MPFEFMRRVQELIDSDRPEAEAIAVATEEFDRRHQEQLALKERLAAEMTAEGDRLRSEAQAEKEKDRQLARDLARIKQGAKAPVIAASVPWEVDSAALADYAETHKVDPAKLERCVLHLKDQGYDKATAFRICNAQLSKPDAGQKHALSHVSESGFTISKAVREGDRTTSVEIVGYAVVWDERLRTGETFAPGFFSQETLNLFFESSPVLLSEHESRPVVGIILELKNDSIGLWCRARVDDPAVIADIEAGRLRAFSIRAHDVESVLVPAIGEPMGPDGEMPLSERFTRGALIEISLVSLPRVPHATFQIAALDFSKADQSLSIWAPVTRVEASERLVFGYAVVFETPDADGHVITRSECEQALAHFRPWANAREMHQPSAIGTYQALEVDDYGLWVVLKVSEGAEDCWRKILDCTYKGFSIHGTARVGDPGEMDGRPVLYLKGIEFDEISVCDRPKAAGALFVLVKKREEQGGAAGLAIADRERGWDAAAAQRRVRSWAGAGGAPNAKYAQAFFIVDEDRARFGSYRLPFADVIDGTLTAIPRGVFAAAGAVSGARGADNPAFGRARGAIAGYYRRMRAQFKDETIRPPWEQSNGVPVQGGVEMETQDVDRGAVSKLRTILASMGLLPLPEETKLESEATPIENSQSEVKAELTVNGSAVITETKLAELLAAQRSALLEEVRSALAAALPPASSSKPETSETKPVSASPQFAALKAHYEVARKEGKPPVQAFNIAAEAFAGTDLEQVLAVLGLTDEEPATLGEEERMQVLFAASFGKAMGVAIAPLLERLDTVERGVSAGRQSRQSFATAPVEREQKNFWDGCFAGSRKKR